MNYKFGLNPSPEPPALKFKSYLLPKLLPPIPAVFGHYYVFPPNNWLMLGNDHLGDCTVAGAMHCIMLWNKIAGTQIRFTDYDAKDDYFVITGGEDTGADIVQVAKYWQKTGLRDAMVRRHKIAAYVEVSPTDSGDYYAAAYLFGACGLGVGVPSNAIDQFERGVPWSNTGGQIEGYHYVPLVGRKANGNAVVISWGRAQEVEQSWLDNNLHEVVAMISEEEFVNDKSPEGFNMSALDDDLAIIGT